MMYKKIIILSGGFDPVHKGHIRMFKAAKEFPATVVVGLNSDAWLTRKKSKPFMNWEERKEILEVMSCIDYVYEFNDGDDSACDLIDRVVKKYGNDPNMRICFGNGGDRTDKNIPEMEKYKDNDRVKFEFGVGGNKKNSSSWILKDWKNPKEERPWGYYRVLHEANNVKVKELTVDPGKKLSMQRHKDRAEYWMVSEGDGTLIRMNEENYNRIKIGLFKHKGITIKPGDWHQLCNFSKRPLRVIEIQYGMRCVEEDIERLE